MKTKLEKSIQKEIDSNIPDIKENIKSRIDWESIKAEKKQKNKYFKFIPIVAAAMTAIIVLLVVMLVPRINDNTNPGGGGDTPPPIITPMATELFVTFSINPKVELIIDKDNKVTSQKGLNEDGVKLLLKENLIGKDIDIATKRIVELANQYGYITPQKSIKIAVFDKDKKPNATEYDSLHSVVDAYLAQNNIVVAETIPLNASEFDAIYEYYHKFNGTAYEETLLADLEAKITATLTAKIAEATALLPKLAEFALDSEEIITDTSKFSKELLAFSKKYNFLVGEFDINEFRYENALEFHAELKDEITELNDILNEIKEGADADKFAERLKDIMEIAKDLMLGDDEEEEDVDKPEAPDTEPEAPDTEPEVTEPEVTEPEVTEPEVTEPEVTEPEVTEPEVTEPEVTEPEVTEPEVTEPEVTEPEVTEPEVTEPEVTEPEVVEPPEVPNKVIE